MCQLLRQPQMLMHRRCMQRWRQPGRRQPTWQRHRQRARWPCWKQQQRANVRDNHHQLQQLGPLQRLCHIHLPEPQELLHLSRMLYCIARRRQSSTSWQTRQPVQSAAGSFVRMPMYRMKLRRILRSQQVREQLQPLQPMQCCWCGARFLAMLAQLERQL
jgi:hypothetical protein